jgi:HEAT repeat protein
MDNLERQMLQRALGAMAFAFLVTTHALSAQTTQVKSREPVSGGRPLSQWIRDLKAQAPQTRNAAAYEIAGMGPEAVSAVPALIAALDDSSPVVRFPVTVALGEIGPGAKAAVPRLQQMVSEEINDEIAASARRALKHIDPSAVPAAD